MEYQAMRRVGKRRERSDAAVRLLGRGFLLLFGTVAYNQYSQGADHLEQLRAACAANGGKITLSNLCINLPWANTPTNSRSRTIMRLDFRLRLPSR
jgi:hypothetical protein